MRNSEKGFLLLTSHLGDPESKPLTVAQFRTLLKRVQTMDRADPDWELSDGDLISIGYSKTEAARIVMLFSRQEQLEYYVNQGVRAECYPITRASEAYPNRLRQRLGTDCPGCLWGKGDATLLGRPMISLVGSRDLLPESREFARQAGREAARQGYVLVSGNARGADQEAQESCLENGGQGVSIVADSLQTCKKRAGVLYLSEDGFDWRFSSIRALSRNRLIHAMSELTLVAQCTYGKGGTWTGTTQNLRRGWSPVFCFADGSKGADTLADQGATPIDPEALRDFSALTDRKLSLFE